LLLSRALCASLILSCAQTALNKKKKEEINRIALKSQNPRGSFITPPRKPKILEALPFSFLTAQSSDA
jgi:hypothetical protein